MPPPHLAADAPILQAGHPVVIDLRPAVGMEPEGALGDAVTGGPGGGVPEEPLLAEAALDGHIRALGEAEVVLIGLLFDEAANLREQLSRILGPAGFDPARDIAGITVNRWSHGYTYEYNSLYDPVWKPGEAPCEIARQRYGNIAIANADAQAFAYTDAAIDQAYRAVRELTTR